MATVQPTPTLCPTGLLGDFHTTHAADAALAALRESPASVAAGGTAAGRWCGRGPNRQRSNVAMRHPLVG